MIRFASYALYCALILLTSSKQALAAESIQEFESKIINAAVGSLLKRPRIGATAHIGDKVHIAHIEHGASSVEQFLKAYPNCCKISSIKYVNELIQECNTWHLFGEPLIDVDIRFHITEPKTGIPFQVDSSVFVKCDGKIYSFGD